MYTRSVWSTYFHQKGQMLGKVKLGAGIQWIWGRSANHAQILSHLVTPLQKELSDTVHRPSVFSALDRKVFSALMRPLALTLGKEKLSAIPYCPPFDSSGRGRSLAPRDCFSVLLLKLACEIERLS